MKKQMKRLCNVLLSCALIVSLLIGVEPMKVEAAGTIQNLSDWFVSENGRVYLVIPDDVDSFGLDYEEPDDGPYLEYYMQMIGRPVLGNEDTPGDFDTVYSGNIQSVADDYSGSRKLDVFGDLYGAEGLKILIATYDENVRFGSEDYGYYAMTGVYVYTVGTPIEEEDDNTGSTPPK